ncbi:DUF3087 domain-containing protein [Halomonas janggokensis]|uniref:DUF3087 domain-containing protein n=1 Tax=Vreelandella janggokensis TaxID=370767 RepID=A0ABT4IRD0_9GAMM|nr:DUF3087 family protein [Halomonas janggokensis]MCZ0926220.1 DUF3087 domain-containing protein [Halomonas janggokensis]MCZ0931287.1 DUF3087 domain-containing protein [Halomonas janggokensis]
MVFTLEPYDSHTYRRKARMITFIMVGQLLIFGLLFAMLLTATFGQSLGLNVLGGILGLLATSAMFAALRDRPWMQEVGYVWQLKQHLSRINSHLPALRQAMQEDNRTALDILAFYHQGLAQLAEYNGRAPSDDDERQRVNERREALALPLQVEQFDPQDLHAFKRG